MPELPEVEVVRRGLARRLPGVRLGPVEVRHPRPVRRHQAGAGDFAARLDGTRVAAVVRRGKFLWLALDDGDALLAHLGMSGQLLLQPAAAPAERHLRVRIGLQGADGGELAGREVRFVDQRMFGGLSLEKLVGTPDGLPAGEGTADPGLPVPVLHIARDPLDPHLDENALINRLRTRRTGIKRALLDQTLVSGIGNIYADEALWRVGLHYARPTELITRPAARRLLDAVRAVMREALAEGGTSFDSLYVDVNGASGYFERALAVYGRAGLPCRRCGAPIRREAFMNRSSFTCPGCQPRPRAGRW
ncbi:MAG TPA: bifunctional DNA-formamidopyrimidine glycosylase/DNA-(apurinic or apyrimidinic site) lyase [Kineosporiaceae bacterium]